MATAKSIKTTTFLSHIWTNATYMQLQIVTGLLYENRLTAIIKFCVNGCYLSQDYKP